MTGPAREPSAAKLLSGQLLHVAVQLRGSSASDADDDQLSSRAVRRHLASDHADPGLKCAVHGQQQGDDEKYGKKDIHWGPREVVGMAYGASPG